MEHKATSDAKGLVNENSDLPLQLTVAPPKKRGVSVGSFRMTNGQSIIASENKAKLLNKVITQVDRESNEEESKPLHNCISPQRNITDSLSKLLPIKSTNKKTLVLDLDETLVHSSFTLFQSPSDVKLKIEIEGQLYDIHVLIRPGVDDFLSSMAEKFELIIFTASLSKYADPLMNIIDGQRRCSYRLFREHCTQLNSAYVKDLKRLNRDLKDVIILDNSPLSYSLNRENGFPILSWFEDKNDKELFNIRPILEFLAIVPDVRDYLPKMVFNNEISFNRAFDVMNSYHSFLKSSSLMNRTELIEAESHEAKTGVSSIGNQIKFIVPKVKSNSNTSAHAKEKPQINIKIIHNNITNVIVNSEEGKANVGALTVTNKNNPRINKEDSGIGIKISNSKLSNSFRTNHLKESINFTEKGLEKGEKLHKKMDSFSFGFNKGSYLNSIRNKYETANHSRQISLNNALKISDDHYQSCVIDYSKLKNLSNELKCLREKKTNEPINVFDDKNASSRASKSMRLTTHQQMINPHLMNKAPNRLIQGLSSNSFNNKNGLYLSTGYSLTEKINTNRPGTTKGNNFKIIKRTIPPSCIRDIKIQYNHPITRKYSANYGSILNNNNRKKSSE